MADGSLIQHPLRVSPPLNQVPSKASSEHKVRITLHGHRLSLGSPAQAQEAQLTCTNTFKSSTSRIAFSCSTNRPSRIMTVAPYK